MFPHNFAVSLLTDVCGFLDQGGVAVILTLVGIRDGISNELFFSLK